MLRSLLVLAMLVVVAPARAETRRAIAGQAAKVPLTTAVTVEDERTLSGLLRFGHFERAAILPWRERLAPLATGGDPLAQLWLARLYDLFPFGEGTPEEGRIAMTWYKRAADQHLAIAESFLFTAYNHGLAGNPVDMPKALAYLQRSYADAAGELKADTCLSLARMYIGPASEAGGRVPGAPDARKGLRYLEEALQLAPTNQTAIDWLISLYAEKGDVARASALAERSTNRHMIDRAAQLCVKRKDPTCAIRLLRRAATFPTDDDIPPQALLELYTLVCRKQLARDKLGDVDTPAAWAFFQQWQRDCVFQPGG